MAPEYIGALAEVIAAAAVVISLLYIARQVRHASQHARLMALQAIAAQMSSHFDMTAANPETARVWNKGLLEGIAALEEAEALQFGQLLGRFLKNYEELFRYRNDAVIDEARLSGFEHAYLGALPAPGFRDFWKLYSTFYAEDFRNYIGTRLADADRLIDLSRLKTQYGGGPTS